MKKLLVFIISFVFAVCSLTFVPVYTAQADDVLSVGELTVHFIDVGQGDACIVELPDERTMLIDAGENKNAVKNKLDEYISTNIKDGDGNAIEYFDYAILTHSDSDHIGSMAYVLGQYPANIIYRPNEECLYSDCEGDPAHSGDETKNCFWGESHGDKSTKTYHTALQAAYACADEVIVTNPYDNTQNVITSTTQDEYEINFYSPLSSQYSDHNNYSPIIVIEYQGKEIVLSGDAEAQNEAEFVQAAQGGVGRYAKFADFSADVIKLGHHGSRTSSSEDYLNVMTKSSLRSGVFVVISCGEGNSYGHPHEEVMSRLDNMGFSSDNILRTDVVGDIVISITQLLGEYQVVYGERTGGDQTGGDQTGGDQTGGNQMGGNQMGGDQTGGDQGGSGDSTIVTDIQGIIDIFMGLEWYIKVAVVAAAVAVVIIAILIAVSKSKRKGKSRRR